MKALKVTFKNAEEILEFVKKVEKYPYPMDLTDENIMVDAKSILGLIHLGCDRVATLTVHADEQTELCRDIEKFIVV
ncbi:MAG: HPr family phosphocarrier protein [Brotaphodocola sp.]